VQAIGFALMEELVVDPDDGRVTNPSLADFKVPTERDLPELRTVLLEASKGSGPYNIKSAGESSNTPTAAAIANAVEDAIGVRIHDLPITAEKVYWALREKKS
jgi:CO/xanthine dehydrogenase Mo-binding subunit